MYRINSRFKVDFSRSLGKGAYSQVYIGYAYDRSQVTENRDGMVAIKHIKRTGMSEKLQKRLLQEVEIMRLISDHPHPNIVKCYEVIDDGENVYLILEFCDSGDLSSLLKKPIKEKYVQYYLCQLNSGLRYLDRMKIFHRDIKPKNILLTRNRKLLKIADFGFAKMVEEEGCINYTLCGSPLYMAPEIMQKTASTTKTDLWSIGMIIYEMLFGRHPFRDTENIFDLMHAVESRELEIPPEGTTNIELSGGCLDLLKKLLEKDPKKRIGWDEFYHHHWVNKYVIECDFRVKNTEKRDDPAIDFSVQSVNEQLDTHSHETSQYSCSIEPIPIIENYTGSNSSSATISAPIPIPKKTERRTPHW